MSIWARCGYEIMFTAVFYLKSYSLKKTKNFDVPSIHCSFDKDHSITQHLNGV